MVARAIHHGRAGYALLAMLWVCLGIGGLVAIIVVQSRSAMASARNRLALTTATWRAEGCIAYARAMLRDALTQDTDRTIWNHIDRALSRENPQLAGCDFTARALGSRLDVNAAPESTVARVLVLAGWPAARADSAAAAAADWTDPDDTPRPNGVERDWYVARGRTPPTNARFVSAQELRRVRGFEHFERLDSLFDVDPGALAINAAPAEMLGLLPGFTERTIREVLAARADGRGVASFLQLRAWLDPAIPEASARIPGIALLDPEGWTITARARAGTPTVTAVVEVRVQRAANTTASYRRRVWAE